MDISLDYIETSFTEMFSLGNKYEFETNYVQRSGSFEEDIGQYIEQLAETSGCEITGTHYSEDPNPLPIMGLEDGYRIHFKGDEETFTKLVSDIKEMGYATPDDFHTHFSWSSPLEKVKTYFAATRILGEQEMVKDMKIVDSSAENGVIYQKREVFWE